MVVQLDTTSEADAKAAAELVRDKAGKLDFLIPCAGELRVPAPRCPVIAMTKLGPGRC